MTTNQTIIMIISIISITLSLIAILRLFLLDKEYGDITEDILLNKTENSSTDIFIFKKKNKIFY